MIYKIYDGKKHLAKYERENISNRVNAGDFQVYYMSDCCRNFPRPINNSGSLHFIIAINLLVLFNV